MTERLEVIKRQWHEEDILDFDAYEWLIQQVGEKIILEQKVKDLEEQFSFSEKFVDKKYQRLQEENQRYKQALGFASSELEYAHITGNIAEKDNLIKQSLEVIDEALKGDSNA